MFVDVVYVKVHCRVCNAIVESSVQYKSSCLWKVPLKHVCSCARWQQWTKPVSAKHRPLHLVVESTALFYSTSASDWYIATNNAVNKLFW